MGATDGEFFCGLCQVRSLRRRVLAVGNRAGGGHGAAVGTAVAWDYTAGGGRLRTRGLC